MAYGFLSGNHPQESDRYLEPPGKASVILPDEYDRVPFASPCVIKDTRRILTSVPDGPHLGSHSRRDQHDYII